MKMGASDEGGNGQGQGRARARVSEGKGEKTETRQDEENRKGSLRRSGLTSCYTVGNHTQK